MKRLSILLITVFALLSANAVVAQQTDKELTKALKTKAIKEARKQAKQYKKQGYYVPPGSLPMEMQLEKSWKYQLMENDEGEQKYLISNGNSVAQNQSAAALQATELAKLDVAASIATKIAAMIDTKIANEQLSTEEAVSINKIKAEAKSIVKAELGKKVKLLEMYKKAGKNIEAFVTIAYNSEVVMDNSKKAIRKALSNFSASEKLNNIFN